MREREREVEKGKEREGRRDEMTKNLKENYKAYKLAGPVVNSISTNRAQ